MWELKNRFIALLLAAFILIASSGICTASEIIVHSGESIQAAVDNATSGDTIIVEPGTYNEDIDVSISELILKSKSENPDDTIIKGEIRISDYIAPSHVVIDGFTIRDSSTGYGIVAITYASGTAKNCKIMNCVTGMAATTDAVIIAENTQFIKCEIGMTGVPLTYVSAENCQFIDCGEAILPGGGIDGRYHIKNNVEIHTDESGKQVTTPIPDEDSEQSSEPPTNNTTDAQPAPEPVPTPEPTPKPVETPTETPAEVPTEAPIEDTGSGGSGSGSSHGGSSSGGGGGSPEPAKNVEVKDTAKVFIPNEKQVTFNFTNNVTVVEYITFTSKKTMGKTSAVVENLKNKSTLVPDLPEGIIYKSFNVWVGNAGYGSSDNIQNASLNFKVEKSWMQENDITAVSLYEYDSENQEWVKLPTIQTSQDKEFLYFTSSVPGYYSFVITGDKTKATLAAELPEESVGGEVRSAGNATVTGTPESPGFGLIGGVVCLFCMLLYRIKGR